jgi:hypothetical protein
VRRGPACQNSAHKKIGGVKKEGGNLLRGEPADGNIIPPSLVIARTISNFFRQLLNALTDFAMKYVHRWTFRFEMNRRQKRIIFARKYGGPRFASV